MKPANKALQTTVGEKRLQGMCKPQEWSVRESNVGLRAKSGRGEEAAPWEA